MINFCGTAENNTAAGRMPVVDEFSASFQFSLVIFQTVAFPFCKFSPWRIVGYSLARTATSLLSVIETRVSIGLAFQSSSAVVLMVNEFLSKTFRYFDVRTPSCESDGLAFYCYFYGNCTVSRLYTAPGAFVYPSLQFFPCLRSTSIIHCSTSAWNIPKLHARFVLPLNINRTLDPRLNRFAEDGWE